MDEYSNEMGSVDDKPNKDYLYSPDRLENNTLVAFKMVTEKLRSSYEAARRYTYDYENLMKNEQFPTWDSVGYFVEKASNAILTPLDGLESDWCKALEGSEIIDVVSSIQC